MDFIFFIYNYMPNFSNISPFFYISGSGWLKLALLNIAVILTIIVFARLFIIHLYVKNSTLNK